MSASEGLEIVQELLSELVNAVCLPPASQPHEKTEVHDDGCFDLCTMSRDVCELLKCYSLRPNGAHVEVCQIKCLDQKASGYCGHYALHFSLSMLGMCSRSDKDHAVHTLSLLTHREHFWRRYWSNIRQLLSQVTEDSWWPWTREHVMKGEIERSYLKYLLSSQPTHAANGRVLVLQYAYGLLQDSLDHLSRVQEGLSAFVRGNIDHLVFILGVTNHWVTLLAHRHSSSKISLLYMDSNNEPVLAATEREIDGLVEEREKKHVQRKGVKYERWKKDLLRQSLFDQRDVVQLLTACLQGDHSLPSAYVSSHWSALLSSFREHLADCSFGGDEHTVKLLSWLESGYSVKGLRDAYLRPLMTFGVDSLCADVRIELEQWLQECVQMKPVTGLEQVNGFLEIVRQVNSLFRM